MTSRGDTRLDPAIMPFVVFGCGRFSLDGKRGGAAPPASPLRRLA